MSTHKAHTHEDGAGVYVKTLVALLILTAITVGASYIDFGSGNIVIALFIATIKASIVALFFMHLRHEKPVNSIIALAGFLFLGIFLMFCFMDQDTRRDPKPYNMPPPALNLPPGVTAPAAGVPPAATPAATPGEKH
jgi:cytochrome c oxidase subunit IV